MKFGIIDKEICSLRVLLEVKSMEAFCRRHEFHKAIGCVYFEDAAPIGAVVCESEFLTETMERENVGNPV
jgi:hypothetical protein